MKVTILMAAFNGSRYIREQLDSICRQSYTDWELLVRDDRSQDNTLSILKEYELKDKRIRLITSGELYGSSVSNFSQLFDCAANIKESYFMFSDQDDIWHEDKIKVSVNYIQQIEQRMQDKSPVLVYGGFNFVDEHGAPIAKQVQMPEKLALTGLLTENHAYGCTMIFNRGLYEKVGHIPATAENHDYWIALVAAAFGTTALNPQKLINYRQHGQNASGTVERSSANSRIGRYIKNVNYLLPVLIRNFNMMKTFYVSYTGSFSSQQDQLIGGYIRTYQKNNFSLLAFLISNRIQKKGILQNLAHYYVLLHLRSKVVAAKA